MANLKGGPDKVRPLLPACRQILGQGGNMEDVLSFLRQSGCYKLDCIIAVMFLNGLSMGEAKVFVHNSETWSDTRKSDDNLHDLLRKTVERDNEL
jgi:hypothetical protein